MMQKAFIATVALMLATALCFAAGPFSMNIGSGAGSLSFTKVYSNGHIDGDDGTFDPGVGTPGTTVWNNCFAVVDADTNTIVFMDSGFTLHTAQAVDGTVANSATQITNNGMTFPGIDNVSANLSIDLTQPAASDTARMTWSWTFNNSSGSAKNLRLIWFFDADLYLTTADNYFDELVGFAPAVDGVGLAAGVGENASGAADMNQGVFAECSKAPRIFGITSDWGSSYYWSAEHEFGAVAPEIVFEVPSNLHATIQGDLDTGAGTNDSADLTSADLDANGLTDAALANDCGVSFQVELTVPASGSDSVNCIATWGKNTTLTGLSAGEKAWRLY